MSSLSLLQLLDNKNITCDPLRKIVNKHNINCFGKIRFFSAQPSLVFHVESFLKIIREHIYGFGTLKYDCFQNLIIYPC